MRPLYLRALAAAVVVGGLVAVAAHADDDASSGMEELEKSIKQYTLDNGLTLIVLERHQAPVVSFATVVRVGSVNEVPGITGVAHVFEHLAFKGTRSLGASDVAAEAEALAALDKAFGKLRKERLKGRHAKPERLKRLEAEFEEVRKKAQSFVVRDEYSVLINRHGGSGLNATTGADLTSYFVSLPVNRLELYLHLEAERFANPVMREFFEEKDVVMEERRMRTESSPVGRLVEEFLASAFKAHPYQQPTIGHRSDLQSLTRKQAERFFNKHYVMSNTTLAIVGDVKADDVHGLVKKYFSKLPKRPQPDDPSTIEPPQQGEKRIAIEARAQPMIGIAYHKPGLDHPDEEVYDVIVSLLAGGRSSRLNRRLVQKDKVAVTAGAFAGLPGNRFPNLFIVFAIPSVGNDLDVVERTMLEEMERLTKEPPTEEELAGVKTSLRAGFIRGMRGNQGLALTLAQTNALTGDWKQLFRSLERAQKVTAEDVVRVAKECFQKKNRIVGWIEPPGSPVRTGPAPAPSRVEDREDVKPPAKTPDEPPEKTPEKSAPGGRKVY